MRARRFPRLAAAFLLAAVFVVGALALVAAPAVAHDQLISSTPEDGGTVTEQPDQIVLEFNNELIDAAPALLIRDAADTTIHLATPAIDGRTATTDFPELGDGTYRLAWSVVSSDGHRIEGFMPFEMATGRPAAPLATAGTGATPGVTPGGETDGESSDGVTDSGGLAGLATPVKVAIGVGGLGAAAAGSAVVVLRGRRGGLRGN